jgi:hypothetical protein
MARSKTVTKERQAQTPVREPVLGSDHPLREHNSPDIFAQTSNPSTYSRHDSTDNEDPDKPPAIDSPILSSDPILADRKGLDEEKIGASNGSESTVESSYGSTSDFGDPILEELIKLEEDHCQVAMQIKDKGVTSTRPKRHA